MTDRPARRPFYWEEPRFTPDATGRVRQLPPGDELAALRRGLSQLPGTVPAMWRFYSTWQDGQYNRWGLAAEHHSLTLFAVHQQSQNYFVHRKGVPFGKAIRALHSRFNEAAVDRRFFAAVTATEVSEVAYHLRGLLRQTHASNVPPSPFDYTRLWSDLASWGVPERRSQAQRRWGLAYYGSSGPQGPDATAPTTEGDQ